MLPPKMRDRIRHAIAELEADPFEARPKADIKWLRGPRRLYLRLRVGDYRVIYTVTGRKVLITKILPRSKAYEWIE